MSKERTEDEWQPIETKPPFTECEERGLYTEYQGLWYFKPTYWRPLAKAEAKS